MTEIMPQPQPVPVGDGDESWRMAEELVDLSQERWPEKGGRVVFEAFITAITMIYLDKVHFYMAPVTTFEYLDALSIMMAEIEEVAMGITEQLDRLAMELEVEEE